MDQINENSEPRAGERDFSLTPPCACDAYELCTACVDPRLVTLIQLKLSLIWAQESAVVRELVGPAAYLRASGHAN